MRSLENPQAAGARFPLAIADLDPALGAPRLDDFLGQVRRIEIEDPGAVEAGGDLDVEGDPATLAVSPPRVSSCDDPAP